MTQTYAIGLNPETYSPPLAVEMYFAQSSLASELRFTPDIQAARTWRSYQEASSYLDENLYRIADMVTIVSMHNSLSGTMLGKVIHERYQVVQILSAGEFCQTYLAQDTHRTGHPTCVVKHFLPANNHLESLPTLRRLSTREAQALKQLGKYDKVPQLLAHFEQNQEFYLVQDFIAGHPLSEELQRGHQWTERQVVQLLQEVLGILEFIHSHGLIHRNIKPSNLIRRQHDNRLVLIDFGSVKQAWTQVITTQGHTSTTLALSIPATIAIGTPGYMPPEQERGLPRLNSDIYALGMIGIQALTGLNPTQLLEDSDTGEVIWQHQAVVSDDLASVLNNMVRYHFRDRYQSATEALQALQPLANRPHLKIGRGAQELLSRGRRDKPRRALIIDGLSNSKTTLALSKVLRQAGGFELEYWPQQRKVWSVQDAIRTCLRWHNASLRVTHSACVGESENHFTLTTETTTVLLYLRGWIEEISDGEAWLVLGDNIRLSRSWLRQELRRSGIPQVIVVLDCPGASSLCDWVEELKLGAEQGQCIIAAAAPCDDPEQFTQALLETLVAAQQQVGLPVAKWVAKLQVKLGIIGFPLHAWLSGVDGVSEILPSSSFSGYLHSSELSAMLHNVIEVLPGSSGSVLQDVQKSESSGSIIPGAAQVVYFPCSVRFQEQYSRFEEILKELIGPIAPILLRQVAAQVSSPQAWVEKLARYLPAHQLLELEKQSISLCFESIQPQSKLTHAPSLKHQAITESEVQQCEQALANFIGPIATILVQNALKSHPQISTAELIEILVAKIPDRQRAVEFHQHLQITEKLGDNESLKIPQNNHNKLEWLQAYQRKAIAVLELLITPIKKRWSL